MKRSVLILLACLLGAAILSSASAQAATAVTCNETISAPGVYHVTANCSGVGITIAASHVVLLLNGHTISGGNGPGIDAENVSGISILGPGTVTGSNPGINLAFVTSSHIQRVTVASSIGHGIAAFDSSGNLFFSDVVTGSAFHGITFNGSNDNVLTSVTSNSNGGNGLYLASSSGNHVVAGVFDSNTLNGIDAGDVGNPGPGDNNQILRSTANSNGEFGILLEDGVTGSRVIGNTAHSNTGADQGGGPSSCVANLWLNNSFGSTDCV